MNCTKMNIMLDQIRKKLPGVQILEYEPMAAHCSFRSGGPVRVLALPSTEESLLGLMNILRENGFLPLLLGNGTNMVFPDAGSNRFVIGTAGLQELHLQEDGGIYAAAGVPLSRLAAFACEHALAGLEFASGIPGTVGGGLLMNAGAYGGELKDAVKEVYVCEEGETESRRIRNTDCAFGYRRSRFQEEKSVILGALFSLQPGTKEEIAEKMKELNRLRREKQPWDLPSCGSAFRRPEGHFAAALIEECGLKGMTIGGARVSEKHAGFIVNVGGATTTDLQRLIESVRKTVCEKKGILLQPEIIIIDN